MRTTHRQGDAPALSAPAPSTQSAPVIAPPVPDSPALSWAEAAILVLMQTGEALRAAQIVTRIHELGLPTASRSKTPAQSVNRDLHTALRQGDQRLTVGPEPGQFQAAEIADDAIDETVDLAPAASSPALSWTEAAILVLMQTGEALRAAQIVTRIHELGLPTASRSKTPAQSVNRDLHTALRLGDPRLTAGPLPGQFRATAHQGGTAPSRVRTAGARRPINTRGPRLPIEPLQGPVHAFGGMRSAAAGPMDDRTQQRLTRTFNRSVERGWIDLYDADAICVQLLGLHPCMLYGTGWWDTLAEADRLAGLTA